MKDQTMAPYASQFSAKEKAVICRSVSLYCNLPDCHPGMFSLLDIEKVYSALLHAWRENDYRIIAELRHKVGSLIPTFHRDNTASFTMYLIPSKVAKALGPNAHRGVQFPAPKKRVTVGQRWSLGHKDYIPDDEVMVRPTMTVESKELKLKSSTLEITMAYQVCVEKQYVKAAMDYLVDNCM